MTKQQSNADAAMKLVNQLGGINTPEGAAEFIKQARLVHGDKYEYPELETLAGDKNNMTNTYTIPEIATLSGLSISTIRRDIRLNHLSHDGKPAYRLTKSALTFTCRDIVDWIETRRHQGMGQTMEMYRWMDEEGRKEKARA